MPAPLQQALMTPLFDDPALFHHHDAIGSLDGGEPVGDQNARRMFQDQVQRLLDLPHREAPAPLADLRLDPVRQGLQPVAVSDLARHRQDILIGHIGRSISDIVCHRAREQERHLRNDPQLASILRQVERTDVVTVDQQAPLLVFVEARHQLGNGRLPGPGVPHQGMRHVYIKPQTPQPNGKGERSHRTDQTEFYQMLTYTDDVDLNAKLQAWENFYNYDRPHLALAGKTPYEVMKSLLQ